VEAVMYGFIDGAVRSGERAATEVIEREKMTVT
jgi:monoamine oxidase